MQNIEKSYETLEKSKRQLENDLLAHKSQQGISAADIEQLRAEIEARSRLELTQQLEAVNRFLQNHRAEYEALDRMRDENERELRKEFEKNRKELLVCQFLNFLFHFPSSADVQQCALLLTFQQELERIKGESSLSGSQRERHEMDAKKYKSLYESEVQLRERLAARLEKANAKASQAQLL